MSTAAELYDALLEAKERIAEHEKALAECKAREAILRALSAEVLATRRKEIWARSEVENSKDNAENTDVEERALHKALVEANKAERALFLYLAVPQDGGRVGG